MEWWRDMFTAPLWQAVQLAWDGDADDAEADTELVQDALQLVPGSRVLDAPCGTGRIAKRLRAWGYDVVGLDATERFLIDAAGAGVPVLCADVRNAPLRPASFEAALCLWGSFGYFDEEGNRAQASALAAVLRPGGRCLIDTIVADTLLPRFDPHTSWEVGGVTVEEDRVYHPSSGRIETTWTFARGSERATQATSVRLYALDELTDLLEHAGFASFAPLDGELRPFGPASERLWLVAATPG